jgi:hypothetical protein
MGKRLTVKYPKKIEDQSEFSKPRPIMPALTCYVIQSFSLKDRKVHGPVEKMQDQDNAASLYL